MNGNGLWLLSPLIWLLWSAYVAKCEEQEGEDPAETWQVCVTILLFILAARFLP